MGGDRRLVYAESMGGNCWSYLVDPGALLLMIDYFVNGFVPSSVILAYVAV